MLLERIGQHSGERQRTIGLILRHLVRSDLLAVTSQALHDHMEGWRYQALFAWTAEKITLWTQLASNLELVRKLDRSPELPCAAAIR